MKRIWCVALLCASVFVGGCAPFRAGAPEGFAPFRDSRPFRAVSPDGVMYQVRDVRHKPRAELEFWREALKKRMVEAGYQYMAERAVKAGEHDGWLLELTAPVGAQDYSYLVGVFVVGRRIVLVESAGEVTRLEVRRQAVMDAIAKLKLR